MRITDEFRKSMNWLHTWTGIALSSILFAIFWMGSLTIFHYEIDQWMMPERRIVEDLNTSFDDVLWDQLRQEEYTAEDQIRLSRGQSRLPLASAAVFGGENRRQIIVNGANGEAITPTDSFGAGRFFYPFHYMLHISWAGLGYWIVGLASMGMLSLIVSGIFIHRKIIQDFFTFRPKKQVRRSTLDMHNMTALVALPLHVLFPLSGIIIFITVYFPGAVLTPYDGERDVYRAEVFGGYKREAVGEKMPLPASVDSFVNRAEAIWTERDGMPAYADGVFIQNPTDKNAVVVVRHYYPKRRVERARGYIAFDAQTGTILKDFKPKPIGTASAWITGAHLMGFDHWPLRWLLFLGGLSGCAMIATGLVFWMRARIRKGLEPGSVKFVRATSMGSITGIMLASAAFMTVNRILPADFVLFGIARSMCEVFVFAVVWVGTFTHAALRDKKAWAEQCFAISVVCAVAVLLNWLSTGDHLIASIGSGLWSVAFVDSVLIASSAAAFVAARQLQRAFLADGHANPTAKISKIQTVAAE